MNVESLPAVNASLNFLAACFLLAGWFAIKRNRNAALHRAMMVCALCASAVFLACYVVYHYYHGSTPYPGQGLDRALYFFILITHIPLAMFMLPFVFAAVWFAIRAQHQRHVRIVRWLWPVWMYVSVTGVLIFLMLHVMH